MNDTFPTDPPPRQPLQPVKPHFAQRGTFKPEVGRHMIIDLPGEKVRALIDTVRGDDIIIVRLDTVVFNTRQHTYKKGDILACRRDVQDVGAGELGAEVWVPITEGEVQQRERAEKIAKAAVKGAK